MLLAPMTDFTASAGARKQRTRLPIRRFTQSKVKGRRTTTTIIPATQLPRGLQLATTHATTTAGAHQIHRKQRNHGERKHHRHGKDEEHAALETLRAFMTLVRSSSTVVRGAHGAHFGQRACGKRGGREDDQLGRHIRRNKQRKN